MTTIACFGDSLIYGYPFGPRASWIARAESLTGVKMLNYGVCGDCCDDIAYRLRSMFLPEQTSHIMVLGGANDIIQMRPQKFIIEDLEKAAAYCDSKGWPVGIVLPLLTAEPDLNIYIEPLREQIESLFAKRAYLMDLQPALGRAGSALQAAYLDGVHPTSAAYELLGTYAAPLLQQWVGQDNCK